MSGKIHGYMLIDVIREEPDGADFSDYKPEHEPQAGMLTFTEEKVADGTPITVIDGPIRWSSTGAYIGSFDEVKPGTASMPFATHRLIEVAQAGLAAEATIRAQLHAGFDFVKEAAEELKIDDDVRYELFRRMDAIEKRMM